MPQVKVISPPKLKSVADEIQYYDLTDSAIIGTSVTFESKFGVRIITKVSIDYSDRYEIFNNVIYQWSIDQVNWYDVEEGTETPSFAENNDIEENSILDKSVINGVLILDQYVKTTNIATVVYIRVKAEDIIGRIFVINSLEVTVEWMNLSFSSSDMSIYGFRTSLLYITFDAELGYMTFNSQSDMSIYDYDSRLVLGDITFNSQLLINYDTQV